MPPRVRFAPSPTGPLHMGGVRTALYNWLFARKNGGTFILRIEDTDQERKVTGAEEYIIESLEWCGLNFDEGPHVGGKFGPYRQSERKQMYARFAEKMVDEGNAYYAFDTPEELQKMRDDLSKQGVPSPQYNQVTRQYMRNSFTLPADEVKRRIERGDPHVVRISVPRKEEIRVTDIIRGIVTWQSSQIDDKVLLKADGMPTYHLANVVDDHLMEITHIIRGEEWLPSTPVHVLLYRCLGWEIPATAHLPLILRPDGNGKLSKRDGDRLGFPVFPVNWTDPETGERSTGYRERGFFPSAFINMLAFLGWNPGGEREIFSPAELVEVFHLEKVHKAGARFDFEKAKWFNQQHLRLMPDEQLAALVKPLLPQKEVSGKYLLTLCGLLKDRATFLSDFVESTNRFLAEDLDYDMDVVARKWNPGARKFFTALQSAFSSMKDFGQGEVESTMKKALEDNGIKMGDAMPLFRVMLTGEKSGPPIFETAELLGKEKVTGRMMTAINKFG